MSWMWRRRGHSCTRGTPHPNDELGPTHSTYTHRESQKGIEEEVNLMINPHRRSTSTHTAHTEHTPREAYLGLSLIPA